MAYQKVYMNQIHSSSLLCQLAQMWRDEVLCDAYIWAGNNNIKAHRVVLVAACPMLQSMDGSFSGSVLEVKLTADIQPDSVFTFLQYLYEGFMVLTEGNVKEVEKIAGLLQVDSVTKCCSDFHKVLQQTTGTMLGTMPKCCFHADQAEFRHVRSSGLMRSAENHSAFKRANQYENNVDVPFKRARGVTDDNCANSLPLRNQFNRQNVLYTKQGVEDSFEIMQSDKDVMKPKIHQNLGLKVSSHVRDSMSDIQVINIPDSDHDQTAFTSSRQSPFMVVNPNKHLAISGAAHRKHSPKTVSQTLSSVIKKQPGRASLFTPVSPINSKMSDSQRDDQSEQIIIQPIREADNSPTCTTAVNEENSEDRNRAGMMGSNDPCEKLIVKLEKPGSSVTMDTDSHGDGDRQTDTSLHDDDGEDEYSEGEIYRYADTSGMVGAEDEPGNAWYIDTLKGERVMAPLARKHKRKPDKANVKPLYRDSDSTKSAMFDACSINNNYPSMHFTGNEEVDVTVTLKNGEFSEDDLSKVKEILNQSNSRQNFAWKLCRYFFSASELRGCNCYGRKGKKPLDKQRLNKIQALSFQYYPLTIVEDYTKAWSNCRIAIDKGIRNIFYDVGAMRKLQETALNS